MASLCVSSEMQYLRGSIVVMFASEPIKAYCGNAQLEDDEECDPGALAAGIDDPCCDKDTCKLKAGAVCRCAIVLWS